MDVRSHRDDPSPSLFYPLPSPSMDSRLAAFFREARDTTLTSADKASVRDIIVDAVRSLLPSPAPEYVPVPVKAAIKG